jgi:hypothetical protein
MMRSRTGWGGASPTETVSRVRRGFQNCASIGDIRLLCGSTDLFEQDLQAIADGDLVELHNLICGKPVKSSARAHDNNSKNPFMVTSAALRPPSRDFGEPNPESNDWGEEADDVARSASEKTVTALQNLASRLGYMPPPNRDPLVSKLPRSSFGAEDVVYCKSALLLQESRADLYSVLKKQSSEQHFICKHCYLEISDFQSNASNYAAEDWSLLASCHVLACSSLKDRRAAYRCFACFAHGYNAIEPSAAAIREHLDVCEFRKIWDKQEKRKLREARTYHSPPVEESEQTAYPPPFSSDTSARDSASLYTQHSSQPSDTTKLVANPQPDARDGFYVPHQNMPAIPRRPGPAGPSPVSAHRTAAPGSPLPNATPFRAAATVERREENDDDSGTRDFTNLPGSFPSAEALAATTPRTPRRPNVHQPSTPTPLTNHTGPASIADRASISGHPEDIINRGRLKSSRRHPHSVSSPGASAAGPPPTPSTFVNRASEALEVAKINELQQLGIPRAQAESLLHRTGGSLNEAADLAFSSGIVGVPVVERQPVLHR